MRFIADVMLGKLARWLRILGYDTLYYPDIEDMVLIEKARKEQRILLTRDTRLIKRRSVPRYLFIEDNEPMKQLKQSITAFGLTTSNLLTRCIYCNEPLADKKQEDVADMVPEHISATSDIFAGCPLCKKVYWKGSHIEKINRYLKRLLSYPKKPVGSNDAE